MCKGGGTLPHDLDAQVQTGALEGSNVNMTQALVDMIENQRSYEVQANLLKEAKDMDRERRIADAAAELKEQDDGPAQPCTSRAPGSTPRTCACG